jgi:hypothetical protein
MSIGEYDGSIPFGIDGPCEPAEEGRSCSALPTAPACPIVILSEGACSAERLT